MLMASLAFAEFSEGHFNFGRQWADGLNANSVKDKGLSHLAVWLGGNDSYNQYWEGNMLDACMQANLTPVIYAYVIAEYDKKLNHVDCDMGSPNHCTHGAQTIRNNWGIIINRYRSYAQGIAGKYGTSNSTIWLIEPDFIQYSRTGDSVNTSFAQEGGGIPDDSLAGYYFNDIVSTIKSALPNAKIAVDISPWLNDGIRTWYSKFDKSKVDYLFTSGGRTQGDQTRIRGDNNNNLTWAQARSAMGGKPIIADDGYGVGGASNSDYVEWLNINNLGARVQDGVIGLTIPEPSDSLYNFAKRYNITITVQGSSSSTQSSSSMSSSSQSSSSMSSSSSMVVTSVEIVSGNATQTVPAGDAISPIVFKLTNATNINYSKPKSLSVSYDENTRTVTISGTLPSELSDQEITATVNATGPNNNASASAKIVVKHKPARIEYELVKGNPVQTVTAGNPIDSIAFQFKNAKSFALSGVPKDLNGELNQETNVYTISGTVRENLTDHEYTYTLSVTGTDNDTTITGKITVKHKPATVVMDLTSGNSTQTVVAGSAIEPIVYSYKNVERFVLSGIPAGLTGTKDEVAKTYTISGTVADSLTDYEYPYLISIDGTDNDTTVTGKITVKHKPVVTVFELVSGNSTQTVVAGTAIEPLVYRYENVKRIELSGIPAGLTGTNDENARTYTVSGIVADSLTDYVYDYTVMVTGIDNNTSATGRISVLRSSSSVASSSSVESSSSEESSSSIDVSSSSEEPSSSSEVPSSSSVESSSSIDISSSSEVPSSSSEVPSSSSVESSSSIDISSSSEVPSSSSEVPSSSSVESSSSEESSSSVEESSSSDNTQVVVTGSLDQTLDRGSTFETVTFSNVQTFNRDSWYMYFLTIEKSEDVVTVAGTVPDYLQASTFKETLTINGQKYEIKLAVTLPESSSSVVSSSSEEVSSSSIASSSSEKEQPSSSSESPATSSSATPETSSSNGEPSSSSSGSVVVMTPATKSLSLQLVGRMLYVSGASDVSVDVFDMQGRPLVSIEHVSGSVNLETLHRGNYVVRLRSGSSSVVRRIAVK